MYSFKAKNYPELSAFLQRIQIEIRALVTELRGDRQTSNLLHRIFKTGLKNWCKVYLL